MAEIPSAASNTATTTMIMDGSDSNWSRDNGCLQNARLRLDNSGDFPSSLKYKGMVLQQNSVRYKGVVLQQNGHWGAQIYVNHQRIWLGTFKSEKAAAMAYDSALIKLRRGDPFRNFPWTDITIHEPAFQGLYTTEEVLSMIKDGSYESKFADYIRARSSDSGIAASVIDGDVDFINQEGPSCRQLFQKELTPSDVGKLNRLVIPKKHAVKWFPLMCHAEAEDGEIIGDGGEDVELELFDLQKQSWKFRYCYWKSSQSFVFTRGWNRFVKDKELKAKDTVIFYRNEEKRVFYIDVRYGNEGGNVGSESVTGKTRVERDLAGWFGGGLNNAKGKELKEMEKSPTRLRLFGADISLF